MRLSAVAVLMILTTVYLSGCAKQEMATVDDHKNNYYARKGVLSRTGSMSGNGAISNATLSDVPVMSVSTNDLPPPSATSSAISSSPASAPGVVAKNNYTTNTANGKIPFGRGTPAPVVVSASPATVTTATNASWQWPVDGKIIQTYGKQGNGTSNEGITIAANEGTPIRAAQGGTVAFVGNDTKTYGNIVILRHADGEMTSYSHAREIIVKQGAAVNAGSVIGYVGKSGNAKSPELHFALRDGNHGVDPLSKLPQKVAAN